MEAAEDNESEEEEREEEDDDDDDDDDVSPVSNPRPLKKSPPMISSMGAVHWAQVLTGGFSTTTRGSGWSKIVEVDFVLV